MMQLLNVAHVLAICSETVPLFQANGIEYAGAMASIGIDNSFDADEFRKNLKIEIVSMSDEQIVRSHAQMISKIKIHLIPTTGF